jgi:hypothetical protein
MILHEPSSTECSTSCIIATMFASRCSIIYIELSVHFVATSVWPNIPTAQFGTILGSSLCPP